MIQTRGPICDPDARVIYLSSASERKGDWSQIGHAADGTARQFYPFDPRPEDVHIEDISLSLSRQARYLGHTRSDSEGLSVAQHSVLVSLRVEEVLAQPQCSRHAWDGCLGTPPTHLVEPPTQEPSWWAAWTAAREDWQERQVQAWTKARRYPVQLLCLKCAEAYLDVTDRDMPLGHIAVRHLSPELRRELLLWALLHDASEAYLSDLPRPIKHMPELKSYRDAEKRVQAVICDRFGLPRAEPPIVKDADTLLLTTEARDLMAPLHPDWTHKPENGFPIWPDEIFPVGWRAARHMFMKRFAELTAEAT